MALFLRFYFFIFMFACLPSCNYETFAYGGSDAKSTLGIQWQAPVERENGEQLFAYEIGGYEVSYRAVGDVQFKSIVIENGDTTELALPVTQPGHYEIRIAAFDTNGLYSQYSDSAILSTQ